MNTRVKELREERELSQTTLATYVGCSQNTISKIELGDCDPKASVLIEMSKYFGVSIDYLLRLTDCKNYSESYVRYGSQPDLMRKYMETMYRLSDKSKDVVKLFAERLAQIEAENKPKTSL